MMSLLILFLLLSSAAAADLNVNDQDQAVIQTICDSAAVSPANNRELRANIAAWCVNWQRRVEQAQKPPPDPPKPPEK